MPPVENLGKRNSSKQFSDQILMEAKETGNKLSILKLRGEGG